MSERLKDWTEMTDAGVIPAAGTAKEYGTGTWRSVCPKIDLDKCVHCLRCWWFCPDSSILVRESRVTGIDLGHCKGCGLCAQACPPKVGAIRMEQEDGTGNKKEGSGA